MRPQILYASCIAVLGLAMAAPVRSADPLRVVVWDEQQPQQKEAYDNFLGNHIAAYLKSRPGLAVSSVRLDDPEQGLSAQVLDNCDVLIWWGHVRQREVKPELGKEIVRRIRAGTLNLIALHSAHWSTPFVEAMGDRAKLDALAKLPESERASAKLHLVQPKLGTVPKADDPLTPSARYRKTPEGDAEITLKLPHCVFPAYRADGKPSQVRTLLPKHPIARDIPATFTIAHTEMYDEPFHVPEPDAVVFEERWKSGEWFRSGCVWQVGEGKVFYFRPGHETFPVYKEPTPLKIVENAARWMGARPRSDNESRAVTFSQASGKVETYDFVEVTVTVKGSPAKNPFTDVAITGHFGLEGSDPILVQGFCDSADGRTYRIRFMPSKPGKYSYSITFREGDFVQNHKGTFEATSAKRRGVLRVDKEHPWHFVWEGTGEHYFFNGTTAFMLLGWKDEAVIRGCLDRFQRYKINRIRVLLSGGRSRSFWGEPIIPNEQFRPFLNPWIAERPDSLDNPGFDYSRFNVVHWQKFERMLRYAREKDIIISAVMDWNDSPVHPAALSADERRYFQHAAARLGAFANLTWDLGDDISGYRNLDWSHQMGTLLVQADPYHHLATDHPIDNKHQDRTSAWFGFTSFQEWSRPQHGWMLRQREAQQKTGRIIPQTNEEYGYEDHYPKWAQNYPNGASADNMRRTAWEIYMAGCYQTTGETARRGTGYWPDTGGGWVNGRGDDQMTMLAGYARIVNFFTRFDWWKTEPHDEWVSNGAFCLAQPGQVYAVYLPKGGKTVVQLEPGRYRANWFNPRTGDTKPLPVAEGPKWTSPESPDKDDWALLLERE